MEKNILVCQPVLKKLYKMGQNLHKIVEKSLSNLT